MAKRIFGVGMLAMVLVFGMLVVGCDLDSGWHEPTNVRTTVLQDGSIHITWDRVPDAGSYEIAFRRNIDSADTRTTFGANTTTNTTFTFWPPSRTNDITSVEVFVRAWRWVDGTAQHTSWVSGGRVNLP